MSLSAQISNLCAADPEPSWLSEMAASVSGRWVDYLHQFEDYEFQYQTIYLQHGIHFLGFRHLRVALRPNAEGNKIYASAHEDCLMEQDGVCTTTRNRKGDKHGPLSKDNAEDYHIGTGSTSMG